MKKILAKASFVIFLISISFTRSFADDFDVMYDRFHAESYSRATPTKAVVDAIISTQNTNGSFAGINYSGTAPVTKHLDNMNVLALSYVKTGSAYYQNSSIFQKYVSALNYWVSLNHQSSNWWDREIGYPQTLSIGYVLVIKEVRTANLTLFNNSIAYLKAGYLINKNMEAANGADKIMGAFLASIITKSTSDMNTYEAHIARLLKIQNSGEGVEVDWMYGAHSWNGRQLNANYCVEYINSLLRYLSFTQGSSYYKVSNVAFLEDLYINGIQWYLYNNHIDPSQTGRSNSSTKGVDRLTQYSQKLISLNGPKKAQLSIVYDRLSKGSNATSKLAGNKMCWRFSTIIHRRARYYVSTRMSSTKTIGMESAPGQREMNYYGGSGINFIFRTGNEYGDQAFFDVFNYRQWPGITVEQDIGALPTVHWGANAQNGNDFAGGVSDGVYGASAYIHQKRNVLANKAWFYFEDEFVALGSGITQTSGAYPLYTTLNQAIQNGTISYSKGNTVQTVSATSTVTNPDWVLQNDIGYINLDASSSFRISSETRAPFASKIFTASIDHGTNKSNSTYAYVVYPNVTATLLNTYKANSPLQILSNTSNVQAIYHKTLKLTQAIFYKAGSLTLANGKIINVNAPGAVMMKDSADAIVVTVANPLCETSNPATLVVSINAPLSGTGATWNGTVTNLVFALPQGEYAGQSIRHIFKSNQLPVITITSPSNNATFNAPGSITISANVTDADGSIASVTFFEGSNWIGNDLTAPYSMVWSNVAAGTYRISVKATDNMGGVQYNSVNVTVITNSNQLPAVSITAPSNNITYTAPATINISANATDSDGSIARVEFYNGTTLLNSDNSAPYSYNWTGVTAGTYTITAKAFDNSGASTTSSAITIVVSNPNVAPTVSITAPTNNATYTAPASVTITANATDSDGSIVRVEFYNGTTLLNSDNSAPYSYNWTGVTAGTYTITAKAFDNSGASTTSSAITIVVSNSNVAPTVSITAPTNNATYTAPASVTITANATDSDGSIARVEFYNGTTLLNSDNSVPYSYTWTGVTAGTYTITAKAFDNSGASTTSSAITIVVSNPNVAPTVSITAPTNNAAYTAPASVTITANATDSDGSIARVEFYNGTTLLNSDNSAPYSYTWTGVTAGTYTITAKAFDNSGASTTSAAITIVVDPATNSTPTISVTSSHTTSVPEGTAVTITVTASDADGFIDKVELYEGTVKIGELTTSPFIFTIPDFTPGNHNIVAVATDNDGGQISSTPIVLTVNSVTGISESESMDIQLINYPNPFDRSTDIQITLMKSGQASITVYDNLGKQIMEVGREYLTPGTYTYKVQGGELLPGSYVCKVIVESQFKILKIVKQ